MKQKKSKQVQQTKFLPNVNLKRATFFTVTFVTEPFFFLAVPRGKKVTDHIIFGTPGTLLDWILRHKVLDPKKIKMFVLDEADVMIALQGHQDQSIRIQK